MIDVTIPGSGMAIKNAAMSAIINQVTNSPMIRCEVDRIAQTVIKSNESRIAAAIQNSLDEALADPAVIGPMVCKALMASESDLHGQFSAVMKRVGKDLALDRKTLEKLVEAVKVEIAQNNEKLGIGMFS